LNKVLFVSLLVLGLCFLQPALGEGSSSRLATRIAGGTQANAGQFPFVALITYDYVTASGVTATYQGTGVIYTPTTIVTTANALANCAEGKPATVYQGVTFVSTTTGAQIFSFTCSRIAGPSQTIFQSASFAAGVYNNDLAYIDLTPTGQSFTGTIFARPPTSSPTAADIGTLFAVGFGEAIPGGSPAPVLQWVEINPQRNHICYQRAIQNSFQTKFNFTENFCVAGFVKNPDTGFVSDVCVLDAGGALIRTSNIGAPYDDHEVVGIINFGTCSATQPAIATYLFKYISSLPAQAAGLVPATTQANPRAFDGNFACGDGIVQAGTYEKCDPPVADRLNPFYCCDPWTCQLVTAGSECTLNNRNGTTCLEQPRCNVRGRCVVKNRNQGKRCNGPNTKCHRGKCCTYPGATGCF